MKKLIQRGLLLLILLDSMGNAASTNDVGFIEKLWISDEAVKGMLDSFSPGSDEENFTNQDDIIFYFAQIGVINPQKKKYEVEIICQDTSGNIIIRGVVKRSLPELEGHIGSDIVRSVGQTLGLDPKPGAMVKGQLMPLKNKNDYFIKLYFEKKLIAVTKFHYFIIESKGAGASG